MKAKLLALCLMAAAMFSTGCMATVRYNRGYDRYQYGPGYRYDRNWSGHERYRGNHHDNRRDYRYDNRDDGRPNGRR